MNVLQILGSPSNRLHYEQILDARKANAQTAEFVSPGLNMNLHDIVAFAIVTAAYPSDVARVELALRA